MKIFFTSDTHFGQERTRILSKRPFNSVTWMDMAIVNNWNKTVSKNDIVYHLGDFGEPENIALLNGKIFLLPGDYDNQQTINIVKDFCTIIKPNKLIEDYKLQLVHEPETVIYKNPDYFFLFGHIHKLQMVKENGLNVGVDCHNFTPITLDDVLFYRNEIENHYDHNVFDPIA